MNQKELVLSKAKDKLILYYLQQGLSFKNRPYYDIAKKINISEPELLRRIKALKQRGIIQRLGAVIHHHNSGYSVNAMVVWKVPSHLINKIGKIMAGFSSVSHCYQRKTYPDWQYNLYTMIHAKTKSECQEVINNIVKAIGINKYEALYTVKEYKKVPFAL